MKKQIFFKILSQNSKCSILSAGIELRGPKLSNSVNKNIHVLVGTSLYSQETPGKGSWLHNLGWRPELPPVNYGGSWPNPKTKKYTR